MQLMVFDSMVIDTTTSPLVANFLMMAYEHVVTSHVLETSSSKAFDGTQS